MKYWLLLSLVLACLYLDCANGCEDDECSCDDMANQVMRPTAIHDDEPEVCDDEMENYKAAGRNNRVRNTEYVLNREDRDYYTARRPNRRVVYTRPRPAPAPRRRRTYRIQVEPEPEPCQTCEDCELPPQPPPRPARAPAPTQRHVHKHRHEPVLHQHQHVHVHANPPRPVQRPRIPLQKYYPDVLRGSKERKALKKAKKGYKIKGSGSKEKYLI